MTNHVTCLLADLTRLGVSLETRGDRLAFHPRSKVTSELMARMRTCKSELLELLRGQTGVVGTPADNDRHDRFRFDDESVSVIIPFQHQAAQLEAAVLSALGQSLSPSEILIVDATGELTQQGVLQFPGVRIIHGTDGQLFQLGLEASGSVYVTFLHPANILPRDYLRSAVAQFREAYVGAVYADHELFERSEGRTHYPDCVDHFDLARSDIGHMAAVFRRDAILALGSWNGDSLLPQLARLGWKMVNQPSALLVRGGAESARVKYFDRQRLDRQDVTLFVPLSGRRHTWQKLSSFLERQTWSHQQTRLVLCDSSQDPEFTQHVKSWLAACDYGDVRHFTFAAAGRGLADEPRNQRLRDVNLAMCRIYNQLRISLDTDFCWILEDDIIPPANVLSRLMQHFDEHVACVSAPYRSRFDGRFLVWDRELGGPAGVHRVDRPAHGGVQAVRGTGFGCLVVRRECLERHVFSVPPGEHWYDPYFFKALGDHWERRVDWSCECRHLHDTPPPGREITRRNLIYHITPFASNDVWLRNVKQLRSRFKLFNGRRVVAIATGDGLVDVADVERAFAGHPVEFIHVANSRRLRENASFLRLLEQVASADTAEATFYAHAKGVATVGDTRGVTCWRNAMYHHLLDDWQSIAELLSEHAVVGTHRRRHEDRPDLFPDGQSRATWHFAGTFFWFRIRDVFSSDRWRDEWQPTGWGAEAWPGAMFPFDRSTCVAFDGLANPYDPLNYPDPIPDEEDIMSAGETVTSDAVKIELGGGDSPRGDGYLNLDKRALPGVDHVCDFETDNLPFPDNSVRAVYSSHAFEHFAYGHLLREIARVCEIGAYVEIKVPHWLSENALCQGHKHTFGPEEVERISQTARDCYFSGGAKRLNHTGTEFVPSRYFEEARELHAGWSDDQVLRYVPNACYEIKYTFHVVENN